MNEIQGPDTGQKAPAPGSNRMYIITAAVLLVVIAVTTVLLITQGVPALLGKKEPTATAEAKLLPTPVATFTPRTAEEPAPPVVPTVAGVVMFDTDTPAFDFDSAGARPAADWTGFFGQVLDADGAPLAGVPVIVWYSDGRPASLVTPTDQNGTYEIRLAEAPLAGTWTLQLLTKDGYPASKLFTFQTDDNTETGIQQIQVTWRQIP